MSIIVNPTNRIEKSGFISRHFKQMMMENLPRRFKRLIYISSILGLIQQVKDPDESLVKKLNEIFKIANCPDAFMFPMYIKSIIWRDFSFEAKMAESNEKIALGEIVHHDLTVTDFNTIGKFFATNAPAWLKYGSEALMISDVVTLVNQLKEFDSGNLAAS